MHVASVEEPILATDDDGSQRALTACVVEGEPALFALLLNALYYSYYQSPLVVAAVRGLGIVYNDAPQPLGYSMAPFDPAPGVGVPTQPRGFYVKTEDARRVELPPAACATEAEL